MQTRLQWDETSKHIQGLGGATRRAACAAVKEFNKSQVLHRLGWGARTSPQPLTLGALAPLSPGLSPFTGIHHKPHPKGALCGGGGRGSQGSPGTEADELQPQPQSSESGRETEN